MNRNKEGIAIKSKNIMMFTVVSALVTGLSFSQIVLVGPDGVLLSDSAPEIYAEAMKSELKKLGNDDVKFIINTHWHHDHTDGNLLFGRDATIIAHNSVREDLAIRKQISLFDEFYKAYPEYALPNLTFTTSLQIYFNDEVITIKHFPGGHTGGDAVVYFKKADVIHVGDMIVMNHFPSIDFDNGGDVEKLVENLKTIISEMSPDTKIISGHLRDANKQHLIEYCDMILSTIAIVKEEMKMDASLKDMQEKEILKDWKDWGKHITCDMWIETIYECMKRK
jgi:cyclase